MERQSKNTRGVGEGDGKGSHASTKAGDVTSKELANIQAELKNVSLALQEIRDVIKTLNAKNTQKIPGVK